MFDVTLKDGRNYYFWFRHDGDTTICHLNIDRVEQPIFSTSRRYYKDKKYVKFLGNWSALRNMVKNMKLEREDRIVIYKRFHEVGHTQNRKHLLYLLKHNN